MNASGEMAGVDRRRGQERILMQRTQRAQRCRRRKTHVHKPRVEFRSEWLLGGSVNMQKTRELGVHFSSRASTRATL